jgi:hypothetical protein
MLENGHREGGSYVTCKLEVSALVAVLTKY